MPISLKIPLLLSFVISVSALPSSATYDFPSTFNQIQYDHLFKNSVKFCTMTRVQKKGGNPGGAFAHAVLFLNNACIDDRYDYPQARPCDSTDQVRGVGISVNKIFKNVNWVGIPGRELFFYGNLPNSSELNAEVVDQLISHVVPMGIYQNIEIIDSVNETMPDTDPVRFKISQSIGTDFAINFGRNIYCANIPLTDEMQLRGLEFINLVNMVYADPDRLKNYSFQYLRERDLNGINPIDGDTRNSDKAKEYNWNGVSNNCTHLTYNMFAAIGLVKPKKISSKPGQIIANMAVPTDRWVSILEQANSSWLNASDEAFGIWTDRRQRNLLNEEGKIIRHHGVIAEHIPFHNPLKNDLFIESTELKVLNPLNKGKLKKYFVKRPAFIYSIKENLKHFEGIYSKALAQPNTFEEVNRHPDRIKLLQFRKEQYESHLNRFHEALTDQLIQVRMMLDQTKD